MEVIRRRSNWANHYEGRVRSDKYKEYFKEKYGLFINLLLDKIKVPFNIKEEGCGIGSVTKCLNIDCTYLLTDINSEMLHLTKHNLEDSCKDIIFLEENILSEKKKYLENTVVITHGVLEHFSKKEIANIIDGYMADPNVIAVVTYVPLNGYKVKSYGDEMLESVNYWTKVLECDHFINIDDKDLFALTDFTMMLNKIVRDKKFMDEQNSKK